MESLSTWGYSGNGYVNQEGHRFMFVGFTDASGTVPMFEAVETPGYYVAGALAGKGRITTSAIVESASTGHSYKEEVTEAHDAFCITAALRSVLENRADAGNYVFSVEDALEEAYGYLAEGLSTCRCMFAGMTGEARIAYLLQFSEYALAAMAGSGYWNESTGERMTITDADYVAVYEARNERDANWLAETLANEAVGDQNSYAAVVASDTDAQPVYSLVVNGEKSEHGTYVNKWGIAYAATRELLKAGIDADNNSGLVAAVLSTLEDGSSVAVGDLELSTIFETN